MVSSFLEQKKQSIPKQNPISLFITHKTQEMLIFILKLLFKHIFKASAKLLNF